VEFLRDVAARDASETSTLRGLGKRVVVVGGGNVAYDVSRTVIRQLGYDVSRSALRQAAVSEVHLCCLESIVVMPADDTEILEGHEEGVELHASLGPSEIVRGPDGRVQAVKFKRCLGVFDDRKRFAPRFDERDVTTIEADTVIIAIGQRPDLSFIARGSDVRVSERGAIECDPQTLRTSAPDVFVAGDIAHGPRLLIDAIASGKRCARSVYTFLTGKILSPEVDITQAPLAGYRREPDYEKLERASIPVLEPSLRKGQATVVETGYDDALAVREACRCLDCGVNTIFDSEKCILCGGCADVCPELCLEIVSCDRLAGDPALAEALESRYGGADLADMSAIVKDEDRCIRCALCVERCPVGAIGMERLCFTEKWAALKA
jgi:ferredoxin